MEDAQTIPVEETRPPWGFWATVGLSVAVVLANIAISVLIVIAFVIAFAAANPGADVMEFLNSIATDGFFAFLMISLASPLCAGLVLLFIRLKATLSIKEYLCLVPVKAKTTLNWFALLAFLVIGSDILTNLLGRPIVPEILVEYYRTSYFVLSWFAIIVAAPIFEEVLFRGFMFRGIQASSLGNTGAILITAGTWAIIHIQYDAYQIVTIFVLGILFGAARAVTGSLYLTIAMHMVVNLFATIEIHLFAGL